MKFVFLVVVFMLLSGGRRSVSLTSQPEGVVFNPTTGLPMTQTGFDVGGHYFCQPHDQL